MAVALMVVPGIAAAWLWVAPRGRLAALRQLLAGGAAMVVVGGAWPLLVALTPASDRPWISGTSDNSIWSLIFGYNGLGRLDGQAGGPQALGGGAAAAAVRRLRRPAAAAQRRRSAGRPAGCSASALVGGVGVIAATRLRRSDARTGWLIAIGGAFLTTAVAFSFARRASSTPTTSRCSRRSPPRWSARAPRQVVAAGDARRGSSAPLAVGRGRAHRADGAARNIPAGSAGCRRCSSGRRRGRGARDGARGGAPALPRPGRRARRAADRAGELVVPDARARHQADVPRGRTASPPRSAARRLRRRTRRASGRQLVPRRARRSPLRGRHAGRSGAARGRPRQRRPPPARASRRTGRRWRRPVRRQWLG